MPNIIRSAKNKIKNFTLAEVKVREATSNDPWGPSSSLMHEISCMTHESMLQREQIMEMILRRMNDHGKNWRHVFKSLILLEYVALTGSTQIYEFCRSNIHLIETLTNFQHFDKDGRDLGINVREKARRFVGLLHDSEQFAVEQDRAQKTMRKTHGQMYGIHDDTSVAYGRSNASFARSSSAISTSQGMGGSLGSTSFMKKGISQDFKNAIPRNEDEEDAQFQLALAISKEELEKDSMRRLAYSSMEQNAIMKSKKESQEEINAWNPRPSSHDNVPSQGSYSFVNPQIQEQSSDYFVPSRTDPFSIPPSYSNVQQSSNQQQSSSQNLFEDIFSTTSTSHPMAGNSVNVFSEQNLFSNNMEPTRVTQELHQPQYQQQQQTDSSSILKQFLGENSAYVDVSFDNVLLNQNNPFSNSNPFSSPQTKKATLNELKSNNTVQPNSANQRNDSNQFGYEFSTQNKPTNPDNFYL